ncbi:arylamine N-acetyltransferase [Kitasatospora paracochleata]|uniref:Arylamine N-acetyltransferase n=1 Tax=Kitasatospora paracochleata TaxID=58354 RepID=A0ABT1IUH2_9ACTN|nr:arylamine N-acetyltransferase [Kitasatospora paracochleata]MCP2308790.1 arylamine N-acetyltransferase [Kitasatospora paracochleata]
MINSATVDEYLRRLRLPRPESPTVAALTALHRAHVEHIPYETVDIHLGRAAGIDPAESVRRVLDGRGGYCYHLNGAFGTLLTALGYEVTWHLSGVQARRHPEPQPATGDHLVLTVRCEGQLWYVDVGLGDGPAEPLPLRAGTYRQGPFEYRLAPSQSVPGGWRLDHDVRGALIGLDFDLRPAVPADFLERHTWLSTSPDSPFAQVLTLFRRRPDGLDALYGLLLIRQDGGEPVVRELDGAEEWFATAAEVFELPLTDLAPAERAALGERLLAMHLAWQQAKAAEAQAAQEAEAAQEEESIDA